MTYSRLSSYVCALAIVVAGCSESHGTEEDAAIILPDSGPMDAGTDAGPAPPGSVGSACVSDTDCSGDTDICIEDPSFLPGGYCTTSCLGGGECPEGSTCLELSRTQAFCFRDCDPTATERQCRAGYGCTTAGPGFPASVCVGGCSDDTDCPSGLMCDRAAGFGGACFDPGASIADPCTEDDECPMSGVCITEEFSGWPGGACVIAGCDVAGNAGCDGDAQCLPSGGFDGGGLCVDGCATDADCRDGYSCRGSATYPDRLACQAGCESDAECTGGRACNPALGTCAPPFVDSSIGGACSRFSGGCTGGTCLDERNYGHPGGYCVYVGCTVGDDTTCGAGAVCQPSASGLNACVRACAVSTDCRAGYRCDHVDPTDDASANGCLPDCASGMCTGSSRVCNPGTGLCGAPFGGDIGEPCSTASECPGGLCLLEADGWPAGTCAYPGCRLSGTGPAVECGAAGVCVDDESGDPEIGHCIDACTVGTSGCRPGYECVELTAGATEGACRPAATTPTP